jgi:hypothetical protein
VFGGDLGQRPKIFRKKIYGSHSPPLVAVFGPSMSKVTYDEILGGPLSTIES